MNLGDLKNIAEADLVGAGTVQELEAFRIKYLGGKGLLKEAMDHLKTLPGPEKRGLGSGSMRSKRR